MGGCHVVYHFPKSTSNDSHFVHYDLHHVTSLFLKLCQEIEALQPALMTMAGPHYLDMTDANDHIYLSVSYYLHDIFSRIRNPSTEILQIFQNIHHEFYDPIIEWLKQSYLASHAANNKL